jgi:hypothetical protein
VWETLGQITGWPVERQALNSNNVVLFVKRRVCERFRLSIFSYFREAEPMSRKMESHLDLSVSA